MPVMAGKSCCVSPMVQRAETTSNITYTSTSSARLSAKVPPRCTTGTFHSEERARKAPNQKPGEYQSTASRLAQ